MDAQVVWFCPPVNFSTIIHGADLFVQTDKWTKARLQFTQDEQMFDDLPTFWWQPAIQNKYLKGKWQTGIPIGQKDLLAILQAA